MDVAAERDRYLKEKKIYIPICSDGGLNTDTQVIIASEWMGRNPTLIEDQVTYPIATSFLGAPKVKAVRGFTMFGMSFVYVIFQDGTDLYWARSRVVEYLSKVRENLPAGVSP